MSGCETYRCETSEGETSGSNLSRYEMYSGVNEFQFFLTLFAFGGHIFSFGAGGKCRGLWCRFFTFCVLGFGAICYQKQELLPFLHSCLWCCNTHCRKQLALSAPTCRIFPFGLWGLADFSKNGGQNKINVHRRVIRMKISHNSNGKSAEPHDNINAYSMASGLRNCTPRVAYDTYH